MTDFLTYLGIFLFIIFIYFLVRNEIRKSVSQASDSSSVLQSERDILEERVARRTRELVDAENKRMVELHRTAQFGELSRGLFHDLMNPLSSLSMNIEQLGSTIHGNAETNNLIQKVVSISKRMNSFMESVRRCIGTDKDTLENSEADVANELYIVRDILAYKARMQKVKLSVECPEKILLTIHPVRLHQLLMNLATNAIDACISRENVERNDVEHQVKISARKSDLFVIIEVTDDGCGMDEHQLSHIGERSFTTKKSGTGIGLITVKSIVEKELLGKLSVQSKKGQGTTFTITIPRNVTRFS